MGKAMDWLVEAAKTETDECLLYPFSPSQRYGLASREGRLQLAHLIVLDLVGRAPTPGQEARHLCGVARCCNPRHLKAGTHAENEADKIAHGSLVVHRGEGHSSAVLTDDAVREIRASTDTQKSLAARFGVSARTIRRVQARQSWAHL